VKPGILKKPGFLNLPAGEGIVQKKPGFLNLHAGEGILASSTLITNRYRYFPNTD
jgi:hypothetical protein